MKGNILPLSSHPPIVSGPALELAPQSPSFMQLPPARLSFLPDLSRVESSKLPPLDPTRPSRSLLVRALIQLTFFRIEILTGVRRFSAFLVNMKLVGTPCRIPSRGPPRPPLPLSPQPFVASCPHPLPSTAGSPIAPL